MVYLNWDTTKSVPNSDIADEVIKKARDNGVYLKSYKDHRTMDNSIFLDKDKVKELNIDIGVDKYYTLALTNYYNHVLRNVQVYKLSEVYRDITLLREVLSYVPFVFTSTDLDKYLYYDSQQKKYGELSIENKVRQKLKERGIHFHLNKIYTIPKQGSTLKRQLNISQRDVYITIKDLIDLSGSKDVIDSNGNVNASVVVNTVMRLMKE